MTQPSQTLGELTYHPCLGCATRAGVRVHDHPEAPRPFLGTDRREHAHREHHRRPTAGRRLHHHHGQRRGRCRIPDARGLRGSRREREALLDGGRRRRRNGHLGHLQGPGERNLRDDRAPDQRSRDVPDGRGAGRHAVELRQDGRLPGHACEVGSGACRLRLCVTRLVESGIRLNRLGRCPTPRPRSPTARRYVPGADRRRRRWT